MIKRRVVLDEDAGLTLDISASAKWDNVTLRIGRSVLGPTLSRSDLRAGRSLSLPDGSTLFVKVDLPFIWPLLVIERDGVVVADSDASPESLARFAGRWLIGIGLLNLLVTVFKVGPNAAEERNAGIVIGAFFGACGFFTAKGSKPALVLGTGLYALGALLTLTSGQPGAVLIQTLILVPLLRAVHAQYRRPNSASRPSAAPRTPASRTPTRPASRSAQTVAPVQTFAETIAPTPDISRSVDAGSLGAGSQSAVSQASAPVLAVRSAAPSQPRRDPADDAARIGPYFVTGLLGSGGMATVYLAQQASIGRNVALKVMVGPDSDPEFGERFRREAETTARLSHPHILKIFDFGEDSGRRYIAMEHLEGGTLRAQIGPPPLPVPQVLRWAEQIGSAIHAAHSQGVVHRDIKPENVLLDRSNNAFLSDFGLARLTDANSNLTRTGVQMGSPSYMSPEQWHGADVDSRADLYSFAAVLFELLSGRPPFMAATLPALMTQHVSTPVPAISGLRTGLPLSLDGFFSRAMSKKPGLRFPDAAAMVAAFRQALSTAALARPASPQAPRRYVSEHEEPVFRESWSWFENVPRPVRILVAVTVTLLLLTGFWPSLSVPEKKPGATGRGASKRLTVQPPGMWVPALVEMPTIVGKVLRMPWHVHGPAFSPKSTGLRRPSASVVRELR